MQTTRLLFIIFYLVAGTRKSLFDIAGCLRIEVLNSFKVACQTGLYFFVGHSIWFSNLKTSHANTRCLNEFKLLKSLIKFKSARIFTFITKKGATKNYQDILYQRKILDQLEKKDIKNISQEQHNYTNLHTERKLIEITDAWSSLCGYVWHELCIYRFSQTLVLKINFSVWTFLWNFSVFLSLNSSLSAALLRQSLYDLRYSDVHTSKDWVWMNRVRERVCA